MEEPSRHDQNHTLQARESFLRTKHDRNRDGVLDEAQKRAMQEDPEVQQEERLLKAEQLDIQLTEVMKKFDHDRDGKLDH